MPLIAHVCQYKFSILLNGLKSANFTQIFSFCCHFFKVFIELNESRTFFDVAIDIFDSDVELKPNVQYEAIILFHYYHFLRVRSIWVAK